VVKMDSTDRYQIRAKSPLQGVYSVNQGYAVFRRIEKISENQEYYIVRTNISYGLSLYDHIILDSRTVKEGQIIFQ
jgi:hypothetical protein